MEKNNKFQNKKKSHWQSYELHGDEKRLKEFQDREFMVKPDSISDNSSNYEVSRKNFLKLMGASTVMATIGCVQRPVEKIIPNIDLNGKHTDGEQFEFAKAGKIYFYATTTDDHCGVLIKCKEGRPLKINGNLQHPISKGGTTPSAQASIFDLYDPDRLKNPKKLEKNKLVDTSWDDVDKEIKKAVQIADSDKVFILSKPLKSPTTKKFTSSFLSKIGAEQSQYLEYSLTSISESIAKAQEINYGSSIVPDYNFEKANIIVSVDCDFMGTWLSSNQYESQYVKRRELKKENPTFNQFIAVESVPTLTGTNADQRIAIQPNDQRKFLLTLAKALVDLGESKHSDLLSSIGSVDKLCEEMGISSSLLKKIAAILAKNKSKSLIVAGGVATQNKESVEIQIAVNLLNSILENDGKTVIYSRPRESNFVSYSDNLENLKKRIDENKVELLFINDVNLLYQLPNSEEWQKRLKKIRTIVSIVEKEDETSKIANFVVPSTHYLESWNDIEMVSNLYSIQQPTIRPLFDSRSFQDCLIKWTADGKIDNFNNFYGYLKNEWISRLGSNGAWEDMLRRGFYTSTDYSYTESSSRNYSLLSLKPLVKSIDGLKFTLFENTAIRDGKQANNSLLQELPDPVSKVTWDNYLALSPQLAEQEGIKQNDMIYFEVEGRKMTLPAYVQPGMHKNTLAAAIGYGRSVCGKVGDYVGRNSYKLSKYENGSYILSGFSCKIEKTGKKYKLATTQHHHMMSPGRGWKERPLVMSTTFEEYLEDPSSGVIPPEVPNMMVNGKLQKAKGANPNFKYKGYKWEMVVDLTKCTGCSACVISCQVENNIPVVGRDEVRLGREMHWLRIDRYYIGDPSKPETLEVAHQPVMCQHCDDAPCETVCPVLATVHSSEGINDMVYNRCVGTRYCSNNCPYKVRRFNWLEHWYGTEQSKAPRHLALNPDITVRSRGVMEKCNFCASEIAAKKILAKNEGRKVKDDDIKVACQTACSADAISFGNVNDKDSKVYKDKQDERAFKLLEYLNVKPAVTYLSRVKNPV